MENVNKNRIYIRSSYLYLHRIGLGYNRLHDRLNPIVISMACHRDIFNTVLD